MAKVELKNLIGRLNPSVKTAMEEAASLCVARGHRELASEHLLVALLAQPGADCRIILQGCGSDPDALKSEAARCFDRFRQGAGNAPVLSPLLVDLLQDAWMIASLELGEAQIRGGAILLALLQDAGRYAHFEYGARLENLPAEHIRKTFGELTKGSIEAPQAADQRPRAAEQRGDGEAALEKFAHCFTRAAREGRIDPVFCRDSEIRQVVDILARRRKNNPICVGEAGVGKTAVVEGLALKIVEGDVPESLLGAEIYGLDLGALQAGASVKGEFEKRLKGVLDEVKKADRQTILFIDEAHTLIGAGGQAGGGDAANLLKPALARGEIKTIAATTWSEYKKYFEKDPALTRRFQLVKLNEPTIEQARIILLGLTPAYEKAHGVYIAEAGIEAAVRLSARYISGRQLPDKAIDVLDTACARVKATFNGVPATIEHLKRERAMAAREWSALERDRKVGHAEERIETRLTAIAIRDARIDAELRDLEAAHERQKTLVDKMSALRDAPDSEETRRELRQLRADFSAERKNGELVSLEVGPAEIASVVGDWTGIPVSNMTQDEFARLRDLSSTMMQTIKGQDHALAAIEEQLQAAKLDLKSGKRPLGVFLLVGPSGTGKTETALEVARRLFGSEQFLITVNMTEYQEKHSLSRLIGSPPGYVGFGEGGMLSEAIRKTPYSVVLLDEAEKADPDVLNLFYQAFDKGEFADGEGRLIDCKNVVFFLTSNLASETVSFLAAPAQDASEAGAVEAGEAASPAEILEHIRPRLAAHFKPALLAHMQPIVYLPLSDAAMAEIVGAKLDDLAAQLGRSHGVVLEMTADAVAALREQCTQAASGARLIDQVIQRRLLPEISRALLQCGIDGAKLRRVIVRQAPQGAFEFDFEAAAAEPGQTIEQVAA
jgi:type VI secretion system protein VasG